MPLINGAVGPVPEGREPDEYDRARRRVLWSLPTGLFVVGSRAGDRRNLMTANWVMQVATTPKLVAVAVEEGSVTRQLIHEGGGFSVSVLSRADRALVRRFVKPADSVEVDAAGVAISIQGVPVREVAGGLPCLSVAVAWLSCHVRTTDRWATRPTDGPSSHALIVGEVVDVGEGGDRVSSTGGEGALSDDDPGILRMEDTRMNYGG